MRYISKIRLIFIAIIAIVVSSCDEGSGTLGILSSSDSIHNSIALYEVYTQSLKLDSVEANSSYSYLGSIIDPETGNKISASYAAQYYCFEGYSFPKKEQMCAVDLNESGDTARIQRGVIRCDSCELRIYFDDYYGDGNNPMKLQVWELSSDKLLEEDSTYYTDTDLTKFLANKAKPIAERVFTPMDYNLTDDDLESSTHSHNVPIRLDTTIGKHIIEKYYENSKYFADSYQFIHHVCPGYYFTICNGEGTMLSIYAGTFNVYFHYFEDNDSTIDVGMARFAATPEVIQSTHFNNNDLSGLVNDNSVTYLKTPAGICTEMTLPIDSIFDGEHQADSVSLAAVTLTRYNKTQDDYQLGTPSELLMVRKQDMHSFFENHEIANSRTSYVTSFNSTYNTYEYTNICRLISYAKHEKTQAVKERLGKTNYTETEFAEEEQKWMRENPDWNKVVLIPVKCSYNSNSSSSSSTLVSVTHDLGLNSIKLVGGDTKLTMQVVYSKFQ